MRNILAIGSFLALLAGSLSAQSPEYYEFEEKVQSPYLPLENAPVLGKSVDVKGDVFKNTFFNESGTIFFQKGDTVMAGVDIGFDFLFDGKTYDKFVAAGVGFIVLGEADDALVKIKSSSSFTGSMANGWAPTVGIGTTNPVYGTENTSIRYQTSGKKARKS